MKKQKVKTPRRLSIAAAALTAGLVSVNAFAGERTITGVDPQVIYQPRSAHHGIYSYPSSTPGETSLKPMLIYVSQAYGPAIHSYAHVGREIAVPWNVEYVDTAYGQAIYSYEGRRSDGEVKVLPIVVD